MAMSTAEIKDTLIKESIDFKRIHEQHQDFERRLDQLIKRPFITAEEEREIIEIKKQKLLLKDRMQLAIDQFRIES